MKKLTAKQRAKIYRQAAEIIYGRGWNNCCGALYRICVKSFGFSYEYALSQFTNEFFLFSPSTDEDTVKRRYWWDFNDADYECRVIALLFSEQIALNP